MVEVTFITFLIVCPLVFVAGFVDAIAGGGGLISVPAYLFAGIPVHQTIGTNKLSSCMGTAVATFRYARHGYMVWGLCAFCVVAALIGSALGANLVLMTDDFVLKIIMLAILPVIAFYVLRKKSFSESLARGFSKPVTTVIAVAVAFVVGGYDGFYGPGTGTFLLLLLTGAARMTLNEAAGTTKVINLTTNIASLVVFCMNGVVLFSLGIVAGLFNMLGAYFGSKFFTTKGDSITRPIIFVVLALFALKLIGDLVGSFL